MFAALAVTSCAPRALPSQPPAIRWESPLGVDHPLAGVLWDVAAGRRIDERELDARVRAASIVLVGETHDNPDHHALEARLLAVFADAHPAPAVVFEMLDRQQQPAVDASLATHPGDADALADAVSWSTSGWPSFSIYRPVFQTALGARAGILAAGLDRATAMKIAHEGTGALDPTLVHAFGLDTPLPPAEDAALRQEMSAVH